MSKQSNELKRFLSPPWYQRFTQSRANRYVNLEDYPSGNYEDKNNISNGRRLEERNEGKIVFRGLAGMTAGMFLSGSMLFLKETYHYSPKLHAIFATFGLAITLSSFFGMVYYAGKSRHL